MTRNRYDPYRFWFEWWTRSRIIHQDGSKEPWSYRLTRYWPGTEALFSGWCDG